MLSWFRPDARRKAIREDRRYLVPRARRLLLSYLASNDQQKQHYYDLVAGATAACQPAGTAPELQNTELSKIIADTALRVVKVRDRRSKSAGQLQMRITDAYATVAMAYRRAAALYVLDEEMQQIGTAAVHMVTIANSAQLPTRMVAAQ